MGISAHTLSWNRGDLQDKRGLFLDNRSRRVERSPHKEQTPTAMSTSTPPDHTDFMLPGTEIRGMEGWTAALAYAYSPWCNVRRVESLFYGIWDTVLNDLVFNMTPNVFVVPQLLLDTHSIKASLNPIHPSLLPPRQRRRSHPQFRRG